MRTDKHLVGQCNRLARAFYAMMGNQVEDAFKFYKAHHPQEIMCWRMAVLAFEEIECTDIENALASMEGGESCPF